MLEISTNILASINHEREHGILKYGFKARPVGEHILLMEKYLRDAKTAWTSFKGDDASLHEIRKLAAVTLQCLTEHGCPFRGESIKNGKGQDELPSTEIHYPDGSVQVGQFIVKPL